MLPSDFDIFSASVSTIPLCIQRRANGRPAASDCAISFSWWGKTRSEPPPWIANDGPSSASAIAEHSMCQPGPPRPPGRVPARVLALLVRLPEGEVERVLLERRRPRLLSLVHVLGAPVGELAVAVEAAHAEVDVAAGLIGVPGLDQVGDQGDDPPDRLASPAAQRRDAPAPADRCPRNRPAVIRARKLPRRLPRLPRRVIDLVVDVGDVDDELRLVALAPQEIGQAARRRRTAAHCRCGCGCRPSAHTRRCRPPLGQGRSSPQRVSIRTSRMSGMLCDLRGWRRMGVPGGRVLRCPRSLGCPPQRRPCERLPRDPPPR